MSETSNAHAAASPVRGAPAGDEHRVEFVRGEDGKLVVRVSGRWHLRHGMPLATAIEPMLITGARPRQVAIDATGVTAWDSSLVSFVVGLGEICHSRDIPFDASGLPPGLSRLIDLAETVPENKEADSAGAPQPFVERVGAALIAHFDRAGKFVEFVGMVTLALASFVRGRSRYRRSDLLEVIQACGANALGIVSLISYLVGVILAYMGAVQLQQFGAAIYVADLVGIGMVREMGAMMTAIIMAGRTGAAFAAQLGSMKVNQEIDALSTMGIAPMEFLVVPRMIALILMMPLLCLYSDFVGILGGATVGVCVLGVSLTAYWHQSLHVITMTAMVGGLVKSAVYGVLIALAGCYQGFECGNSSAAVGEAATAAVVSAIVMIVVACGMFAVLFNILGI
jgi:phospholipid/cholesterol/gamma-HCH transport system permease protein